MFIEIEDYKTDRDQKRRSNDQSSFDASDVLLIDIRRFRKIFVNLYLARDSKTDLKIE